MTWTQQITLLVLGLALLALTAGLVRKRRLRADLSVPWFAMGLVVLVLAIGADVTAKVARWLGFEPEVLVLLVVLVCLAASGLRQAVGVSRQAEREADQAERLRALRKEIESLRDEVRQPPPPPSEPKPKPPSLRT